MYKILFLLQVQKDLDEYRGKTFGLGIKKIIALKKNPRSPGCLKLRAEQGCRIRSGNYRIIYRIDDKRKEVFIYRIKHRKEAY